MIALNDIPAAKKYISQALQVDPGLASAHLHQGIAWLLEGDIAAARQSLERASSLDSHGPVGEQARRLLNGSAP